MEYEPIINRAEEDIEDEVEIIRTPEEVFNSYQEDFNIPIEDLKTKSILDVGANEGKFVRYLREKLGNTKAIALEYQEIRTPEDRPEWWVVGSGLDLPFADESFEIVTAHSYLSMFYDRERGINAITELVRVLKPGGTLYYNASTSTDYEKELQEIINYFQTHGKCEDDNTDERDKKNIERHIEGAKKFEQFQSELLENGYQITRSNSVVTIKKPG